MIIRDKILGTIGQHNLDYPDYLDFGDSASRCGIMTMCGSAQDLMLLRFYVDMNTLKLRRHPTDIKWMNTDLTSRDQLICFAAGVSKYQQNKYLVDKYKIFLNSCVARYAKSWFINKDILTPDVRLFLYKSSGRKAPLWIRVLGYPLLFAHLLYNCFIVPKSEQNQMICICSVMGKWWLKKLYEWHPDLDQNLIDYWCGKPWRDQSEFRNAMIDHIKRVINSP